MDGLKGRVLNMTNIDDEFHFIHKITPPYTEQKNLIVGIGDDAALYHSDEHVDQVVCMDTMVENVHFSRKTMNPFDIGYKVLASNISDVAAMGGRPLFYLVSIAIPRTWQEDELLDIYEGMKSIAAQYEMDLIGGDTVSIKESLVISVTVIGEVQKGKKLLRSNARHGDLVFVTGTIGDSSAGLEILLHNQDEEILHTNKDEQFLIGRHQRPSPRVNMASLFAKYEMSLNDISDGLASELHEIAGASHVTIVIDQERLPFSEPLQNYASDRAIEFALFGGEDFELVGTISAEGWDDLQMACIRENLVITEIGRVEQGPSSVLLSSNGKRIPLKKKGYNHFKSKKEVQGE